MLKIWGRKNSSNVRKALWIAEELGLPYESINAGGAFGIVNEPAYRAMNLNGRLPVIDDDGFVLWESNAIVRYLADRRGPTQAAAIAKRSAGASEVLNIGPWPTPSKTWSVAVNPGRAAWRSTSLAAASGGTA